MRKTLLVLLLGPHGRRKAQSHHQSLLQPPPTCENKWQKEVLKTLFTCCLLQDWWPAVRLWPRASENALLTAQLCLFIIICFMGIFIQQAGGPRPSWVLGMLCKEKSHCFHCEILPQATYECSREDIHHFQQNSWQIHLLLLVILGAIFKCFSNIHSYSSSEKPSSSCMTTAREGRLKSFALNFWIILRVTCFWNISTLMTMSLEELGLYNEFPKKCRCSKGKFPVLFCLILLF